MADGDRSEPDDLAAGEFSPWLAQLRAALRGEAESEVPCGGCTACCTSSQFVPIGPDETDTLALVPESLRFPAPGLPAGHVVLGCDDRGHCPMLVDGGCSIYEHRPRACRTYDCRVFAAAGVDVPEDKPLIAERVRRWRFAVPAPADRARLQAVRAAARFLADHAELLPHGVAPRNAQETAVLAVEVHGAFLSHDEATGRTTVVTDPRPDLVLSQVRRSAGSESTP